MNQPKYKTCRHVTSIGQTAVFVEPGCPRASMIKGRLVSSKKRCEECRSFERVQSALPEGYRTHVMRRFSQMG